MRSPEFTRDTCSGDRRLGWTSGTTVARGTPENGFPVPLGVAPKQNHPSSHPLHPMPPGPRTEPEKNLFFLEGSQTKMHPDASPRRAGDLEGSCVQTQH